MKPWVIVRLGESAIAKKGLHMDFHDFLRGQRQLQGPFWLSMFALGVYLPCPGNALNVL